VLLSGPLWQATGIAGGVMGGIEAVARFICSVFRSLTASARIHFSPFTFTYSNKSEQSPLNSGSGLENMRATEVLRGGNGSWNALHFKQFRLRIIKIIARGLTSERIVIALV